MANRGGQPGNQNASVQGRVFDRVLRMSIAKDGGHRLQRAANKLLDAAANGEQWAIEQLANRLDGRPPTTVDVTQRIFKMTDVSDAELAAIATGRSDGATEAQGSEGVTSGLH